MLRKNVLAVAPKLEKKREPKRPRKRKRAKTADTWGMGTGAKEKTRAPRKNGASIPAIAQKLKKGAKTIAQTKTSKN